MRKIYDFSALEGIFGTPEANALIPKIKETIKENVHSVAFREVFILINPDDYTLLSGTVYVHIKRIYSLETYKPIKEIYTIGAYKLVYSTRKSVWDEYYTSIETIEKKLYLTDTIESVYTDGTPA